MMLEMTTTAEEMMEAVGNGSKSHDHGQSMSDGFQCVRGLQALKRNHDTPVLCYYERCNDTAVNTFYTPTSVTSLTGLSCSLPP